VQAPIRHPQIGWLRRGEKRGSTAAQAGIATNNPRPPRAPAIGGFRFFKPDPASNLVVGVNGPCLYLDDGESCTDWNHMFEEGPLWFVITGATRTNSSDAFEDIGGTAADGVASIRAFFTNGTSERLALKDNLFTGIIPSGGAFKLVSYDAAGRISAIQLWRSFQRVAPAGARRLRVIARTTGARGTSAVLSLGPEVENARCWRLTTSAGPRQSACEDIPITGPWVTIVGLQQSGGDAFVFGRLVAPAVRAVLRFDDGRTRPATVADGWFLAAVPAAELSTARRHAVVEGLDRSGGLVQQPAFFYR
jgi:hypothetical protein